MLIQFSVTNFLSFRDETVLSLSTNKDNSHSENLLSYKNERILQMQRVNQIFKKR